MLSLSLSRAPSLTFPPPLAHQMAQYLTTTRTSLFTTQTVKVLNHSAFIPSLYLDAFESDPQAANLSA